MDLTSNDWSNSNFMEQKNFKNEGNPSLVVNTTLIDTKINFEICMSVI